jgi:hypothetical protein
MNWHLIVFTFSNHPKLFQGWFCWRILCWTWPIQDNVKAQEEDGQQGKTANRATENVAFATPWENKKKNHN